MTLRPLLRSYPSLPPHLANTHPGAHRCYNGANQWQLGWSKAVAVLNNTSLQVGRWREVTIPPLVNNASSIVQVRLGRDGGAQSQHPTAAPCRIRLPVFCTPP